jgi:hypothetical protein
MRRGTARRDDYTTAMDGAMARDGAALRQWGAVTAPRRRGKARARQGTAQHTTARDGVALVCRESDVSNDNERGTNYSFVPRRQFFLKA